MQERNLLVNHSKNAFYNQKTEALYLDFVLCFICFYGVCQKHRHRHRTDAARHRRYERAFRGNRVKVYVAAKFAVFISVHTDVDDHRTVFNHIRRQKFGFAYGNAHNIGA